MFRRNFIALSTVFLLLINDHLNAQDSTNLVTNTDSTKTLFANLKINTLGLYLAPEIQYGQLAGAFTGFRGGSAMLLLNNKFAIGINANSNFRNFTPTDLNSAQALRLQTHSLGLRLEYTLASHKLVHLSFPMTLGLGNASVDSVAGTNATWDDHHFGSNSNRGLRNPNSTRFSYIQPGIHLDINVFKYGKFFVGAGYRFNIYNSENTAALVNLTNAQLSGLTFQTGFKLGIFGVNVRKKPSTITQ